MTSMRLLVDSPAWSVLLRRRTRMRSAREEEALRYLRGASREGGALILGVVRQEVLSGIVSEEQFTAVRDGLRPFADVPVTRADYEEAAVHFNLCRARGVQPTSVDALICAVALRLDVAILTLDNDFFRYRAILGVALVDLTD